jgi:hypothetical protein
MGGGAVVGDGSGAHVVEEAGGDVADGLDALAHLVDLLLVRLPALEEAAVAAQDLRGAVARQAVEVGGAPHQRVVRPPRVRDDEALGERDALQPPAPRPREAGLPLHRLLDCFRYFLCVADHVSPAGFLSIRRFDICKRHDVEDQPADLVLNGHSVQVREGRTTFLIVYQEFYGELLAKGHCFLNL